MVSAMDFGAMGDGKADDTDALQKALDATFDGGDPGFLSIPPGSYRVTRTLRVSLHGKRNDITHQSGLLAHGARVVSDIANGDPVLYIESKATVRFVIIEGLQIQGAGREGHGLQVECQTRGTYFYNFCLRDFVAQGLGGDGLHMTGNIFEGQIVNSYFRDNGGNGATFSHGRNNTVLSAIHVMGCVFGGNRKHGAVLTNGAADVGFHGCYFLLNGRFGLVAKSGCPLLSHCGFENNHASAPSFEKGGAGLNLKVSGTLIGCTAYSIYQQTHLVNAYITNDLVMIGCTGGGDGKAKGAMLAMLKGKPNASISVIGCRGKIETGDKVTPSVLDRRDGGRRFSSDWDSDDLIDIGGYRLWVDAGGQLRIKRGRPAGDDDGRPVGFPG